jgi:hypothetical protein
VANIGEFYQHYTDPIPAALLNALQDNRCVLLAGAGVSSRCLSKTRTPLPGWGELLRGLVRWGAQHAFVDESTERDLSDLIGRRELLLVAEELLERIGGDQFAYYLDNVFDPNGITPARRHHMLVALPFRLLLTTNYDSLLERAYQEVYHRNPDVFPALALRDLDSAKLPAQGIVKLHGDLSDPTTIVLGHRDYLRLMADSTYHAFLRSIFGNYVTLMVGYSLGDADIQAALDHLAVIVGGAGGPHFLLSLRGARNRVERRRLARDRNVHVIEYIDHFGFHNHVDTFLDALLAHLPQDTTPPVPPDLVRRIHIHYPPGLAEDGLFLWNYLFREGAITWSHDAQIDQIASLRCLLDDKLITTDDIVFLFSVDQPANGDPFVALVRDTQDLARKTGKSIVYVLRATANRPNVVPEGEPVFRVPSEFSERDLLPLRRYFEEKLKQAGGRT